jgi:hypothetical protein
MSLPPLTHHEIIRLVEPFTRRGRHLDLGASDRMARSLCFKPVPHPASAGLPALTETLRLDNPAAGRFRMTRMLSCPDGLAAILTAEGADAETMLAQFHGIGPESQLRAVQGAVLAREHRLEGEVDRPCLSLTRAVAAIGALRLAVKMPAVRGMPAELELSAATDTSDLPEDLLAVLGWRWSRLIRTGSLWRATLRLRGDGEMRSRDAEARLDAAVLHLAATLTEAPAGFHRRHRLARWGVFARRGLPLLAIIALIAGGVAIPSLDLAQDSVVRMLIFNSPPLLMIVIFGMREVPRIEIPPMPRASTAPGWNIAATCGDALPAAAIEKALPCTAIR